MITRSFFDPCWHVRVYVLCPATPALFNKFIRRFEDDFEGVVPAQAWCCATEDRGVQIVAIGLVERHPADPDWLAGLTHECFHATEYILQHRGIVHSEETSEVFAYLLDSLFRRSLRIINKPVVGNPVVVLDSNT